jgi:hypothetical protein
MIIKAAQLQIGMMLWDPTDAEMHKRRITRIEVSEISEKLIVVSCDMYRWRCLDLDEDAEIVEDRLLTML